MGENVDQSFNKQQVEEIMQRSVQSVLKSGEFNPNKVQEWLSQIFEDILRQLSNLGPQFKFKYCAHGIITQNCGAGLHQGSACHYEKNQDNFGAIKYEKGSILCTLVVYGFKI